MAHYDPNLSTAQNPPPLCPKCGSHRTEVVGLPADGRTLVIRCNACGERSEVKRVLTSPDMLAGIALQIVESPRT